MSVFWPDAPPDSARNNLNVALHNLRQSFRSVTNLPVVEFHNEAYRFNPNLQIWLDVDEFEHHIQAGLKYKQSADIELAIKEYEIGIDQYQAALAMRFGIRINDKFPDAIFWGCASVSLG